MPLTGLKKKNELGFMSVFKQYGCAYRPFQSCKICFLNQKSHNSQGIPLSISHFVVFVVLFSPEAQCKLSLLQSAYHLRFSTPVNRINIVSHKRLWKVFFFYLEMPWLSEAKVNTIRFASSLRVN